MAVNFPQLNFNDAINSMLTENTNYLEIVFINLISTSYANL